MPGFNKAEPSLACDTGERGGDVGVVEEVDAEGAGRTLVPTAADMAARTSRRVDAVFGNADAQHTQFFGRIDAATPQTTSSHIGEPIPSGHRVAKHLRMPEASARDIGSARGVRVVVTAFSRFNIVVGLD